MDYLLEVLPQRFDLATAEGKQQIFNLMRPLITAIPNERHFEQDNYSQRLAQLLGVTPDRLRTLFERSTSRNNARSPNQHDGRPNRGTEVARSVAFHSLGPAPKGGPLLSSVIAATGIAPPGLLSAARTFHPARKPGGFRILEGRA